VKIDGLTIIVLNCYSRCNNYRSKNLLKWQLIKKTRAGTIRIRKAAETIRRTVAAGRKIKTTVMNNAETPRRPKVIRLKKKEGNGVPTRLISLRKF
jgi:hypothetical protein